jgi:hypothetical protein
LNKCTNKKEYGIIGKITLTEAEPSKRIFFTNEQKEEFTLRYFIQDQAEKAWKASYTLYKQVPDETGSHGEEISCGNTMTHYVL